MDYLKQNNLKEITDFLIENTPDLTNFGLLNGKMGISLYFFHLAKITENHTYYDFAGQLIDDVYEEVQGNRLSPDFANGLAGIAWGIEYLAQNNFVDASPDQILSDVDDKIYLFITNNEKFPTGIENGVLGYVSYVLHRLHGKDLESASVSVLIFKRLLIELINRLGSAIEQGELITKEPRLFDITWELPLCLYILSQCRSMDIHIDKIDKIVDHISPVVLSLYPHLQSHRLYLLYSMEHILGQTDRAEWRNHTRVLKQELNVNDIITHEFKNKNINLRSGAAGIFLMHQQYTRLTEDASLILTQKYMEEKIITSDYWSLLFEGTNSATNSYNLGFLNGIAGISMTLLKLLDQQHTTLIA